MWGWSADKGTRGGRTVAAASCFSQHPDCLGARAGATLIFKIPEGYLHTCSEWGGGETDWKNIRIWTHKPTDWRCKGLAIKKTLSKLWCIHRSDVSQAEEQVWAAACTEGSNACVGTPGREAQCNQSLCQIKGQRVCSRAEREVAHYANSIESWSKFLRATLTQVAEGGRTPDETPSVQVLWFTALAKSFQRGNNNRVTDNLERFWDA